MLDAELRENISLDRGRACLLVNVTYRHNSDGVAATFTYYFNTGNLGHLGRERCEILEGGKSACVCVSVSGGDGGGANC